MQVLFLYSPIDPAGWHSATGLQWYLLPPQNNINTVRLTSYFSVLCVFIFLLASFLFLFCDPLYWREGKTDNNIVKYTVIYRCSNELEHKAEKEGFAEVLFYMQGGCVQMMVNSQADSCSVLCTIFTDYRQWGWVTVIFLPKCSTAHSQKEGIITNLERNTCFWHNNRDQFPFALRKERADTNMVQDYLLFLFNVNCNQ